MASEGSSRSMKNDVNSPTNDKRPLAWLRVLLVVATAAAVAITIFLSERTFRETKKIATEQFNQQQLILAQSAARGIESYFKELSVGLQSLAKMPQFRQTDPECMQCMEHTYWGFPTRTSLRLLDKDGALRFIYPSHDWRKELIGRNYSKDAFFREAAQNGRTGVHVVTNEQGEARIRVAVAVYSTLETETIKGAGGTGVTMTRPSHSKPDPDRFCGVLVGSLDPRMIAQNLVRPIVSGKTGYAWLLDDRGVFLAHHKKDFVGRNAFDVRDEKNPEISYQAVDQIQQKMLAGKEGMGRYVSGRHRGKEGQIEKLIAYAPVRVDSKVWSVAVCAPVSEVEEVICAAKRSELYTLGFVILVLITGGFSCYLLSYRWSRSLERQVRNRTNELKETSDYLNRLIRYANAPIIVWDPDRKITIFNKAFEQMSGRREAEMFGGSLDALFPSGSRSESLRKIESTAKGQFWENVEIPILHEDGQVRVVLWNSANIYAGDGKTLLATVAQGQDITERKRAEEYLRKSEERFRAIFETAQDSIFIKDRELRYVQVNPAMERLFGLPASELIGKTDAELFGEESGPHITEVETCVLAGKIVEEEDAKPVRGSPRTFHVVKVPMRDNSGEITGLCGIARDVTARKQAEEALRESRQKFATMAENVPGILFRAIVHEDGSMTLPYVSPSARKFGLYGAEEMSVQPELLQVVIHPDYLEQFKEMTVAASGKLEPIDWEVRLNTQFTKIEFIRVIARPQAMADGDVAWDGLALDITTNKQAEESLKQSEHRFRLILEKASDGINIAEYDPKTHRRRLVMCNDRYAEMSGRSREELMAEEDLNQLTSVSETHGRLFHENVLKGLPSEGAASWLRPDGRENYYEWTATPLKVGEKYHVIGIDRDITERKHAEESLRREKDRAQEYLDVAGVLLMAIDADQKIIRINKKGCEILGYEKEEELIGKHYFNNFIPERLRGEVLRFFKLLMAGKMEPAEYFENPVLTRSGEERILAWHNAVLRDEQGEIYAVLCSGEDITDRKQAEEETTKLEAQLRQAVKMEAIGRLAGGIAHDFNNMLAIIQGYADLLLKDMSSDDRNRGDVESIRTASKRAAALTRRLLAFGRKQTTQPKVLDMNEIVADADSMLQRIIGEDIELETIPGKNIWRVKVDPDQIEEQVILNLAVNAREAMPDGGRLTIETSNIVLDEDYASRHANVNAGEYVVLTVGDTGIGMTKEVMARIFEPYFSTKEAGTSSGLGLSTVYGIIKQSDGHIWVYSESGKGTTFKIYLPRVDAPAEHLKEEYEPGVLPRGTETILMAEDEPAVRDVNCRVLRERGYTILEAPDGSKAMHAAEKSAEGKIHLLITDVVMPHMSGKDLADRIKTVHPNIKVLFVSGYTDNAIVHHGVLDKGVNFLAKPFSPRQLIRTVRRVLDTKA